MTYEKSCGGIVYRKFHGNTEILLIKHIKSGYWSFPKGHAKKEVVYFVARARNYDYTPQLEEISEIRWVGIGQAHNLLVYDNDKLIVNKAKSFIALMK